MMQEVDLAASGIDLRAPELPICEDAPAVLGTQAEQQPADILAYTLT